MMNQNSMRPTIAWQWIVSGWTLFWRTPMIWLIISMIYVVVLFVLNMVPVVGSLGAALLSPILLAGLMHGSREVDQGRQLTAAHLFYALQDSALTTKLIILGLIPMTVSLTSFVLIKSGLPPSNASMIVMAVALLASLSLLYAVPLVIFKGIEPGAALKLSLITCLRNLPAVIILFALALVLAVAAAIPFGLGLLAYIPIMVCSVYASYNQVLK